MVNFSQVIFQSRVTLGSEEKEEFSQQRRYSFQSIFHKTFWRKTPFGNF